MNGKKSSNEEGDSNDEVQICHQSLDTTAKERWNLDQVTHERLHSQQVGGGGTSGRIGSITKKKSSQGLSNMFGQSHSTK